MYEDYEKWSTQELQEEMKKIRKDINSWQDEWEEAGGMSSAPNLDEDRDALYKIEAILRKRGA